MSAVRVRPQSCPTARATASKEAMTQCSSAFDSCACEVVPRHTCARAVLGTSTSMLFDAASLSAAHMARSFRSSAMRAPESSTVRLTGVDARVASARRFSARNQPTFHARFPTLRRRAATPRRGAFFVLRRQARKTWAPCPQLGVQRERAPHRTKPPSERHSYHDITAARQAVKRREGCEGCRPCGLSPSRAQRVAGVIGRGRMPSASSASSSSAPQAGSRAAMARCSIPATAAGSSVRPHA